MEGIKVYVRNAKESKLAQKKAFKLGLGWEAVCSREITSTKYPFLFFSLVGNAITYCINDFTFFKEHKYKELSLSEWLEYEPLRSKKKKWKKLSDSDLTYTHSGIKIKDPNIILHSVNFSENGFRERLTIECDMNDIKVKR